MLKTAKKTLAIILAVLTLSCSFATGAFATETNYGDAIVIDVKLDNDNSAIITVSSILDYTLDNIEVKVMEGSTEKTVHPLLETNQFMFTGFTNGVEYDVTVTADVSYEGELKKEDATSTKTVSILAAPTADAFEISKTSTTITINQTSKATGTIQTKLKDDSTWNDVDATDGYTFEGLTANTAYYPVFRYKETDNSIGSLVLEGIKITTKLAGYTDAVAPQVKAVTKNSVTLVKVTGYEYAKFVSADADLVWQSSNVFSSLTAGTSYTFYQRKTFDSEKQDASAVSSALTVKTNTSDIATATATKDAAAFKVTSSKIYANSSTAFQFKAISNGKTTEAVAGDTRLIPSKAYFVYSSTKVEAAVTDSDSDGIYTGSVTFPAKGTYTVTLEWKEQIYWFVDDNSDGAIDLDVNGSPVLRWKDNTDDDGDTVYKTLETTKVTSNDEYNKAREIFQTIISYISKAANLIANFINKYIITI